MKENTNDKYVGTVGMKAVNVPEKRQDSALARLQERGLRLSWAAEHTRACCPSPRPSVSSCQGLYGHAILRPSHPASGNASCEVTCTGENPKAHEEVLCAIICNRGENSSVNAGAR